MPPIEALAAGQGRLSRAKAGRAGRRNQGARADTQKSPFSQTHAISSLPYDLNAYFHREGMILGVFDEGMAAPSA